MLKTRQPVELPGLRSSDLDELSGSVRKRGPALHVKVDGHRVVERRGTELRRLQRQFSGVVARPARFQDDALDSWRSETYVPARQRWDTRLERDVRAICSEAGLSAAAADAVTVAARRGAVPQNPGVLLSRLLRFQECLAPPLGRRGVLGVLRAAPSLLRYSPESLRWNVDMLAALLPDGAAVAAAVQRAPMLLGASAITIWGNFEGLRGLLRLDHEAALRLVVRAPRLLLNSRGALEGRLEALALLAGGGGATAAAAAAVRRRVAAAVARQPALLGYFPGTLERNLRVAAAALGVPFSRVQPLLLKQPALVMLARGSLRARVTALRDAVGLSDPEDLASVVLRQPSLLTLSPDSVRRKVGVVAGVLGLEGAPTELSAVLRGSPQLLTLAEDSVRAKAAALRQAVAPCGALRKQLERAPPQTVALWLCMSARRYEHVREVAESAARDEMAQGVGANGSAGEDREAEAGKGTADLPVAAAVAAGSRATDVGLPPVRRRGRPRRVVQLGSLDVEQVYTERLRAAGVHDQQVMVVSRAAATEAAAEGSWTGAGRGGGARIERRGDRTAAAEATGVAARRPRLSLYSLLRDGGASKGLGTRPGRTKAIVESLAATTELGLAPASAAVAAAVATPVAVETAGETAAVAAATDVPMLAGDGGSAPAVGRTGSPGDKGWINVAAATAPMCEVASESRSVTGFGKRWFGSARLRLRVRRLKQRSR